MGGRVDPGGANDAGDLGGGSSPDLLALARALRGPAQIDQVRVRRAAPQQPSLPQRAMTPAPWERSVTAAIVRLLRGGG